MDLAILDICEIWLYSLSRERKVPFGTCRLWTMDHLCHNAPPDWESSRQLGSKVIFPNVVMVHCAVGGPWSTVYILCETVPFFRETDYSLIKFITLFVYWCYNWNIIL